MKKFLVVLLAALMVFSFAACGGGGDSGSSDDGTMKVAMITDYGDITDQSFNQTTYEACKAFCEKAGVDFTYKKPASDADADRISSIEEAIEEGYNVIVMPGYAFANAIYEVAPTYPDTKFVALDVSEGDLTAYGEREFDGPNVYSAVYQEEIAGYMAGYAAVKLGYTKLGFLGGMAVPAVQRYGGGFIQGADAAAEELGKTDVEIKYVYGGQFFGDADITAAMDTWYGAGTECVFACGGGIFTSAAEAAAKTGGKVIGVDVDQAAIIDGAYGEGMTVTSAMKGLAPTVDTLLGAIKDGKWDEYKGQIQNLGLVSETPSENYVQLPEESTQWADGFQEADYQTLVKELFNGDRTVSNDTTKLPETKNVKVDDQGAIKG
ncbi:MAG: BMP family ABC transporter substrate-binding protein [Clostridiales bacterium]|jgi:basic membrane protein A|nr:BMP family ABC transporter substrate-binding protein [Clostridiales bacterium]